jgi:hypothetical protein
MKYAAVQADNAIPVNTMQSICPKVFVSRETAENNNARPDMSM